MGMRLSVTETDLRILRDLTQPDRLTEDASPQPGEVFPPWWAAEFARLLEADVCWSGGDIVSKRRSVDSQAVRPDGSEPDPWATPEEDEADYWLGYSDCDYVTYSTRSGDHRSVHKLSDFSTTRFFFAHDPWAHYLRNVGVRHHITVPLCRVGEIQYDMGVSREGGSDFTERHRLLLELMRPHLVALHRRALARLADDPDLTPRQWEVIRLVAGGLTDAQIARHLGIAEATVGKHLEGIYARLGTNNRVAAVNKALGDVAGSHVEDRAWRPRNYRPEFGLVRGKGQGAPQQAL